MKMKKVKSTDHLYRSLKNLILKLDEQFKSAHKAKIKVITSGFEIEPESAGLVMKYLLYFIREMEKKKNIKTVKVRKERKRKAK